MPTRLPGITRRAIADSAGAHLAPPSTVVSDGLACFAGVTDAGCTHQPAVVGGRKPKDLPMFQWLNTVPGNLKTSFSGADHSFDFSKYAERVPGPDPVGACLRPRLGRESASSRGLTV